MTRIIKKSSTWLRLRRVSQLVFLALFLSSFSRPNFGSGTLAWPVDLFFRFDPLALATNLLSFGPLLAKLFWSLLFVALTFILGRFFCGWVCPMGTTLDGARQLLFRPGPTGGWRRAGAGQILSADHPAGERPVLGEPAGALRPAVAAVPHPGHRPLSGFRLWGGALRPGPYRLGPPVTSVSEPVYQFFKATLLPFRPLSTSCRS